jgi:hypothetical protein
MIYDKESYGVKVIILISFIIILIMVISISCSKKKDNPEITDVIVLNAVEIKLEADKPSELYEYSQENDMLEDDERKFPIPETYEEALELMNKLKIENVVLERIMINGETYTVVEVEESGLTVGTDAETKIYDIPDKSGNILLTIPYKKEIQATVIAIIEEPSIGDWGEVEHWVKIKMEDDTIGWVRGEYTSIDRGGYKYLTKKNIWLDKNWAGYWR